MAESDFFTRNNLPPSTISRCHSFAAARYPTSSISPAPSQGYCSYTLFLKHEPRRDSGFTLDTETSPEPPALTVLQFRPPIHALNLTITTRARAVYGTLAPAVDHIGTISHDDSAHSSQPLLHIYTLGLIPGTSLADLRALDVSFSPRQCRAELVRSFARFIARGWACRVWPDEVVSKGLIGSSLRDRLEKMHASLPRRFRPVVERVLAGLERIEALPWVLTHGDVVPSNIMVGRVPCSPTRREGRQSSQGPTRLEISGMLDWAEAEYLPFGIGLYGLEEFLGESSSCTSSPSFSNPDASAEGGGNTERYPPADSTFTYYPSSAPLRDAFWDELARSVPELAGGVDAPEKLGFLDDVQLARKLGILLWHGIAFDDGALDRVVEEGRDDEEVRRLDLFLLGREYRVEEIGDFGDFGVEEVRVRTVETGEVDPLLEARTPDEGRVKEHGPVWWSWWARQLGVKALFGRIAELFGVRSQGYVP